MMQEAKFSIAVTPKRKGTCIVQTKIKKISVETLKHSCYKYQNASAKPSKKASILLSSLKQVIYLLRDQFASLTFNMKG
jgi:hypothetical protein